MESFTPWSALAGGLLIGLSAALLLLVNGRVAGISGILGSTFTAGRGDTAWRIAFLAGLVAAPLAYAAAGGTLPAVAVEASPVLLVAGGLLVGFGSRLGSGCTSGHGVCGLARLSRRSLVATVTFMATAAATVFVVRHLLGA